MAKLLHNPETLSKAQRELRQTIGRGNTVEESDIPKLPYLQAIIKETFRLHPPFPLLLPHQAEADVEVKGLTASGQVGYEPSNVGKLSLKTFELMDISRFWHFLNSINLRSINFNSSVPNYES